eukprot:CAMPEP_0183318974 /NCGR_PEP_ID=MMETSP0160_2-20130417/62161_1 /TAXON_ID=2839 ORGANISM="Odontella Sinensis, Strain Grunow 1884" /NCGR_SAMPLE_ID=MMETSP0160_2 /ASSEMBLY_ACC=CAM_ASM_000250 /LENGTH=50 /DNA_ID=CAMNT_0025485349 /DNA_START=399 /DNA_END=546 /DNA_ORIENTATION=-
MTAARDRAPERRSALLGVRQVRRRAAQQGYQPRLREDVPQVPHDPAEAQG